SSRPCRRPAFVRRHNTIVAATMVTQPDEPQRIARLTPVADVLARIDALVARVEPGPDEVAIAGRILARDVTLGPLPRVPLALRDGWAVRSDLTTDAGPYAPAPLPAATRIEVGQPMPAGTDAVAPLDVVTMRAGRIEITAPVAPGDGALPAGGDG